MPKDAALAARLPSPYASSDTRHAPTAGNGAGSIAPARPGERERASRGEGPRCLDGAGAGDRGRVLTRPLDASRGSPPAFADGSRQVSSSRIRASTPSSSTMAFAARAASAARVVSPPLHATSGRTGLPRVGVVNEEVDSLPLLRNLTEKLRLSQPSSPIHADE